MSVEDEIKAVANKWNKALAVGDLIELSQLFPHDKRTLYYDIYGEKYVGYDSIIRRLEEMSKIIRIRLTSKEMIINSSGNVAWVAEDQHGKIVDLEGNIFTETPLKCTSVLVKRDNKWVFVQIHHSSPDLRLISFLKAVREYISKENPKNPRKYATHAI